MTKPLRIGESPQRTYTEQHSNYKDYKVPLQSDFHSKCGYCDVEDGFFSGKDSFHIDHFAPKKKFPAEENNYQNLVYSCPYCNRSKSDDWLTDDPFIFEKDGEGYIDPCDTNYDANFCRDSCGNITPLNSVATYMYNKLKFYLRRHSLLWNLRKLELIIRQLQTAIDARSENDDLKQKMMNLHYDLTKYFLEYLAVKKEGLN